MERMVSLIDLALDITGLLVIYFEKVGVGYGDTLPQGSINRLISVLESPKSNRLSRETQIELFGPWQITAFCFFGTHALTHESRYINLFHVEPLTARQALSPSETSRALYLKSNSVKYL